MRDRNKLLPEVKVKLEELEVLAENASLHFIVTQTLRSQEEQQAYYSQGRDSLEKVNELRKIAKLLPITDKENKSIITRAKTVFDSFHAYGLAFDVAIINNGNVDWSEDADWNSDGISDWIQLGKLGESINLEWGGNFSSLRDLPHFQYRMGKSIPQLKQELGII